MHYHIVGIAGAGMSAMATVLLDQGHTVSGSDVQTNRLTTMLAQRGARIYHEHHPQQVVGADVVLITSAVSLSHPEVCAAQAAGIPIRKRIDVWREWSHQRAVIAVAGTHGKTTTTAMLAYAFTQQGINVGFLIGGDYAQLGKNAQWGDPDAPLIIEADEYDKTFLGLFADIAVVTNIEWDHPDIYPTWQAYQDAFCQFVRQTRRAVVLSTQANDVLHTALAPHHTLITYGMTSQTAVCNYHLAPATNQQWHITTPHHTHNVTVALPGAHVACNMLATVAVTDLLHVDQHAVVATLASFQGVARRFEQKGEAAGVLIIDDYAHHPTEVAATLAAAQSRYPSPPHRIIAYIQPHTFSRTAALWQQWQSAVAHADMVFIGDVYGSREEAPHPDSAKHMAQELAAQLARHHQAVYYAGSIDDAIHALAHVVEPGDVLITMGAGDGYRVGEGIRTQRTTL